MELYFEVEKNFNEYIQFVPFKSVLYEWDKWLHKLKLILGKIGGLHTELNQRNS